jgi:hypothetical protein
LIVDAKQQLAIASQSMSDEATPTWTELAPFFKGGGTPICRDSGTYAINAISNNPTCTIAEHVLTSGG